MDSLLVANALLVAVTGVLVWYTRSLARATRDLAASSARLEEAASAQAKAALAQAAVAEQQLAISKAQFDRLTPRFKGRTLGNHPFARAGPVPSDLILNVSIENLGGQKASLRECVLEVERPGSEPARFRANINYENRPTGEEDFSIDGLQVRKFTLRFPDLKPGEDLTGAAVRLIAYPTYGEPAFVPLREARNTGG